MSKVCGSRQRSADRPRITPAVRAASVRSTCTMASFLRNQPGPSSSARPAWWSAVRAIRASGEAPGLAGTCGGTGSSTAAEHLGVYNQRGGTSPGRKEAPERPVIPVVCCQAANSQSMCLPDAEGSDPHSSHVRGSVWDATPASTAGGRVHRRGLTKDEGCVGSVGPHLASGVAGPPPGWARPHAGGEPGQARPAVARWLSHARP